MTSEPHTLSKKDSYLLAGQLLAFPCLLAGLAHFKPRSLPSLALFTGVCVLAWAICHLPNSLRTPRVLLIPATLGAVSLATTFFPQGTWLGLLAAGVGLPAAAIWSERFRLAAHQALNTTVVEAGKPIGWTVSHLVLATAYYLVLTPIGLVLKMVRPDAMLRHIDPAQATYWIQRQPMPPADRYFRQF